MSLCTVCEALLALYHVSEYVYCVVNMSMHQHNQHKFQDMENKVILNAYIGLIIKL